MPLSNNNACIRKALTYLYDVDAIYFDDVSRDSEEMVKELNLEYKDIVFEDFKQKINHILSHLKEPYIFGNRCIMAYQKKMDKLTYPYESEKNLVKLYQKATERSLMERIFSNNKADVIAFHHALQDVTVWKCRVWLEERIKDFVKPESIVEE